MIAHAPECVERPLESSASFELLKFRLRRALRLAVTKQRLQWFFYSTREPYCAGILQILESDACRLVILACSCRANQRKFVALPKLASTFRLADLAGLFLRCIFCPALLACDASSLSHMSAEDFPMRRVQPGGKGVSSWLGEALLPARGQSRISIVRC